MYAVIYEHPKAGIWINFVVLFQDGSSITFTNTQDRGMEKRPGHPTLHVVGGRRQANSIRWLSLNVPGNLARFSSLSRLSPNSKRHGPMAFNGERAEAVFRWRRSRAWRCRAVVSRCASFGPSGFTTSQSRMANRKPN